MAHDIATDVEHNEANAQADLWEGGKPPFKASYGKLMMWYFLLSDAFTFSGFLISYGALRFSVDAWPVPDFVFRTAPFGVENGPLIFVTFMTFVLIVSSVTVLRAVQEGKLENRSGIIKWMIMTIFGGAIFLGCQAWEWTNLISTEGTTIYTNPFSSHVDEGRYLKGEELAKYANEFGWATVTETIEKGHGEEATKEEITYYKDSKGTNYFVKADHHYNEPKSWEIKKGDPYLIAYDHNLHDDAGNHIYRTSAYVILDDKGQPLKNDFGLDVVTTEEFGPKAFGALFFFITGFHGFHVFSGLIILLVITINVWSNFYGPRKNGHEMVEKVGLYWHFVDLVWVFVFLVFYLI